MHIQTKGTEILTNAYDGNFFLFFLQLGVPTAEKGMCIHVTKSSHDPSKFERDPLQYRALKQILSFLQLSYKLGPLATQPVHSIPQTKKTHALAI